METRSMTKKRKTEHLEDVKESSILKLTDDCLLHVFSFLSIQDRLNVVTVCRRWKNLGSEVFRNVTTVNLIDTDDQRWKRRYSKILPLCGKFLQDLSFFISEGSTIIQYATKYCRNLKKLRVQFDYELDRRNYCLNLGKLFNKNQKLQCVVIEGMQYDFPSYAECLLELPRDLMELELWSYNRDDDDCDDRTPLESFDPIIRVFTHLQRLVLFAMEICDDDLKVLEAFQQLKCLEIRCSAEYCFFDIDTISNLNTLEHLALSSVRNTTDAWYANLVKNNPDLKHLELRWCELSRVANKELFKLTKLEILEMTRSPCCWIYDYDLSGFHTLKELNCNQVNDEPVMSLLEMAPQLELLKLSEANITPRVLRKAHEVISRRNNGIRLTIIVSPITLREWKRPEKNCELLSVVDWTMYYDQRREKKDTA